MRAYVIKWDYMGRNWIAHRTHILSAYNLKDARERFNDWHEAHGEHRPGGELRHPFHITIHRAQEATKA